MVYKTVRCAQCGKTFEITNGEKEFFDKKGFQLPKNARNAVDNVLTHKILTFLQDRTTLLPITLPHLGRVAAVCASSRQPPANTLENRMTVMNLRCSVNSVMAGLRGSLEERN